MESHLVDLIKVGGPISISSFMNEALFNPKHGYYTSQDSIGRKGDFITAPEISQVFGELIGVYIVSLWQNNHDSKEISLVEAGSGNATLIKDLLNFASKIPNFLENVSINIIEVSSKLRKIQQKNLKGFNVKWWDSFADFYANNQKKPIFFIANEFLDCFAINQYLKIDNFWVEKLVGLDENSKLQFMLSKKDPKLDNKIKELTNNLGKNNDIFEHSPALDEFMNSLCVAIKKTGGIAINIDYGYIKNDLKNTLQSVKNHKFNNILENIGKSDITSLVNFGHIAEIAKNQNLQSWVVTQKEFLESLGIEIRSQKLLANKTKPEQEEINSSISRLINKDQMGELFKVLVVS